VASAGSGFLRRVRNGGFVQCPCGWRAPSWKKGRPHYAIAGHVKYWRRLIKKHGSPALIAMALLAASPCMAANEAAPPMTITRIDGKSVNPLVERLESNVQSMVLDVALVVTMNVHGVTANPPPPKFDKPYANVEIVYDLPGDWAGEPWGWTDVPSRPGSRCVVHLAPLGSVIEYEGGVEILEEVGLSRLLRHEMGHCNGAQHPSRYEQDKWAPIKRSPGTAGYKLDDDPRKLAELEATYATLSELCPTSGMNTEAARNHRQAIIEKGRRIARDFDRMLAAEIKQQRGWAMQSDTRAICSYWRDLVESGR
jgi:hypothetical protein